MTTTVTLAEQKAWLSTKVRERSKLPLPESDPSYCSSAPGSSGFTDGGALGGEGRGWAIEGARWDVQRSTVCTAMKLAVNVPVQRFL